MLWIHPLLQSLCLILAAQVLYMGINRFRFQHLRQKAPFNWKRHVLLGKAVAWTWLAGWMLGLYVAQASWGLTGLTGGHHVVGMLMPPLILVGLVSGFLLQKPSGRKPNLALLHGIVNTLVFSLALYQFWSGFGAVRLLLLD